MGQNKQQSNVWRYLPTWNEAKWWISAGVIWAAISAPALTNESVREGVLNALGATMTFLGALLPFVWALFILSVFWPYAASSREALIPSLFLGALLGGFAGYILRFLFKILVRR